MATTKAAIDPPNKPHRWKLSSEFTIIAFVSCTFAGVVFAEGLEGYIITAFVDSIGGMQALFFVKNTELSYLMHLNLCVQLATADSTAF